MTWWMWLLAGIGSGAIIALVVIALWIVSYVRLWN